MLAPLIEVSEAVAATKRSEGRKDRERENADRRPKATSRFRSTCPRGKVAFPMRAIAALRILIIAVVLTSVSACSSGVSPSNMSPTQQSHGLFARAQPVALGRMTTVVPSAFRFPPRVEAGPGWVSPDVVRKALLYVANYNANSVTIYSAVGHNQAPIGKITSGIDGPEGMAVDRLDRLFVTNTSNNTVTVYRRGGITPVKTYSSGLNGPAGVVIGNDGTVYVSNLYGNNVDAYARGSSTPTRIYTGLNFPIAVTLDAVNNLYVTNGSGITKFPSGSTHGTNLGIVLQNPSGIAIDKQRNIVVANQMPPGIYVYPPGKTQPSLVFGKEGDPNPIAFLGSEQRLFAGEPLSNTVNVYAYPTGAKVNAITNGALFPAGLAVDPAAPF